jgi:hypothetical protein
MKIGILAIVAALAASAIFIYLSMRAPAQPPPRGQPIPGVPYAYRTAEGVFINVTEAAEGDAEEHTNSNIEYEKGPYWLLFVPAGIFNGNIFHTSYVDGNQKLRMQINDTLDPQNGIIEGWMAFNIRNNVMHVNVFLDQDWRDKVGGATTIIWGDDWDNIRDFSWRSVSPGIYTDEISFPADSLISSPSARINVFVSNATLDIIKLPELMSYVVGMQFS